MNNNDFLTETNLVIILSHKIPLDEVNDFYLIKNNELEIQVEKAVEEKSTNNNLANNLVDDFGEFDPKLDLSKFKFPDLKNLLKQIIQVK